jgi:hypothetical protein
MLLAACPEYWLKAGATKMRAAIVKNIFFITIYFTVNYNRWLRFGEINIFFYKCMFMGVKVKLCSIHFKSKEGWGNGFSASVCTKAPIV